MSYLKIKENIKKLCAVMIVIAITLLLSTPAVFLFIYIVQHKEFNILLVVAGIIIVSIEPIIKTAKIFSFNNLVKLNSGKYPAPVEKPGGRYIRIKF